MTDIETKPETMPEGSGENQDNPWTETFPDDSSKEISLLESNKKIAEIEKPFITIDNVNRLNYPAFATLETADRIEEAGFAFAPIGIDVTEQEVKVVAMEPHTAELTLHRGWLGEVDENAEVDSSMIILNESGKYTIIKDNDEIKNRGNKKYIGYRSPFISDHEAEIGQMESAPVMAGWVISKGKKHIFTEYVAGYASGTLTKIISEIFDRAKGSVQREDTDLMNRIQEVTEPIVEKNGNPIVQNQIKSLLEQSGR